jgi:polysaccharide export outer membrane protein
MRAASHISVATRGPYSSSGHDVRFGRAKTLNPLAVRSIAVALLAVSALLSALETPLPAQSRSSASAAGQTTSATAPADIKDKDVAADVETLRELWDSGRYRITPGDVLNVTFPYVPEFDQTFSVQPDGYIALRAIDDVYVAGLTVPDARRAIAEAYSSILRDAVVTIVLKDFDKPYFVAAGEVARPGRYEIRGATTLTQALALAGGPTSSAKRSAVVLFRRYGAGMIEVKQIDVQKMYAARDLSEDPILRPGDTLFIPKSRMSAIAPYIPKPGLGLFGNLR